MPQRKLFLIGMMGLARLGRRVTALLGLAFADADAELDPRLGMTIATLSRTEGEASFRWRESEQTAELTGRAGIVLATGGGVVGARENRHHLATRGGVVHLQAAPGRLWRRVRHGSNRPMLDVEDPRRRVAELDAARDPVYREVAAQVVDASRDAHRELAARLRAQWSDDATRAAAAAPTSCRSG